MRTIRALLKVESMDMAPFLASEVALHTPSVAPGDVGQVPLWVLAREKNQHVEALPSMVKGMSNRIKAKEK